MRKSSLLVVLILSVLYATCASAGARSYRYSSMAQEGDTVFVVYELDASDGTRATLRVEAACSRSIARVLSIDGNPIEDAFVAPGPGSHLEWAFVRGCSLRSYGGKSMARNFDQWFPNCYTTSVDRVACTGGLRITSLCIDDVTGVYETQLAVAARCSGGDDLLYTHSSSSCATGTWPVYATRGQLLTTARHWLDGTCSGLRATKAPVGVCPDTHAQLSTGDDYTERAPGCQPTQGCSTRTYKTCLWRTSSEVQLLAMDCTGQRVRRLTDRNGVRFEYYPWQYTAVRGVESSCYRFICSP